MTRTGFAAAALACFLGVGYHGDAAAQSGVGVGQSTLASTVDRARKALMAGQAEQALNLANSIIATSPAARDAVAVKVDALLALGEPDGAFRAYEAYSAATGREDRALLAPVARGALRAMASAADSGLAVQALTALARSGDQAARTSLERLAKDGSPDAVLALARLGDAAAARQAATLLARAAGSAKSSYLQALMGMTHADAVGVFRSLLKDPDPFVRSQAAEALGLAGDRRAVPLIKPLLKDRMPMVAPSAALALKRLGDPEGEAMLRRDLTGATPHWRLKVAAAYAAAGDRAWIPAVRPLLRDSDPVARIGAAVMLVPEDAAAAIPVLKELLADSNPAVRMETARQLSEVAETDIRLLRPLLRDPEPRVRLHAASLIVARPTGAQAERQQQTDPR